MRRFFKFKGKRGRTWGWSWSRLYEVFEKSFIQAVLFFIPLQFQKTALFLLTEGPCAYRLAHKVYEYEHEKPHAAVSGDILVCRSQPRIRGFFVPS